MSTYRHPYVEATRTLTRHRCLFEYFNYGSKGCIDFLLSTCRPFEANGSAYAHRGGSHGPGPVRSFSTIIGVAIPHTMGGTCLCKSFLPSKPRPPSQIVSSRKNVHFRESNNGAGRGSLCSQYTILGCQDTKHSKGPANYFLRCNLGWTSQTQAPLHSGLTK